MKISRLHEFVEFHFDDTHAGQTSFECRQWNERYLAPSDLNFTDQRSKRSIRDACRFVDGEPNKGVEEEFARDLQRTKYAHWQYEEAVRVFVELDHSTIENGSYF